MSEKRKSLIELMCESNVEDDEKRLRELESRIDTTNRELKDIKAQLRRAYISETIDKIMLYQEEERIERFTLQVYLNDLETKLRDLN